MSALAEKEEKLFDCRVAFASTLEALAEDNTAIVTVVNDSVGSSKLGGFQKRWPERLVNVGIAEQNMVGVGAGLANGGRIPFVSAAGCFLTARALEQIKADVCYTNTNVKLVGQSSGVAYGELGPTHHSIEDMAWLRALPNLKIIVPSDPWETSEAVRLAASLEGPFYLRISRFPVPAIARPEGVQFRLGVAETLKTGNDAAIIANGVMVHRALEAAAKLAGQGIDARVINMSSIAPLDIETIVSAAGTGAVVTVEEGSVRGGLGGAVAEVMAEHCPARLKIMGFPEFAPTGSISFLYSHFNLTADGITASVRGVLEAGNDT
ncbi:transketolase C-terminal domain-containing protein [uncultured Martelella sp.]|uniref:transketolase family protein n=1 Tax=uncultured Martelella sp. TaxID=392331 RepID=UPI0029C77A8A|nr:transketolase C-terminal domain-containing protein [uncultured Martelella sp.]